MQSNELVSIIIPVYNAENYIDCCINSVKEQSYTNIELILIDDCSTDNTRNVIEKNIRYNKQIKRIIFIKNTKNMGAGYSRNRGLDIASGKYLVFLDADDFFCPDMIEKLYFASERNCADIVICNYYLFKNGSGYIRKYNPTWNCPNISNVVFKLKDIKEFAFQYIHEIAWNKMFRHEFVKANENRFQEQFNADDQFFVFASALVAEKIVKIEDYLLYYRIETENQQSKSISKNPYCIWNATKATLEYINKLNQYSLYKKSFNTYMIIRLSLSLECLKKDRKLELLKYYQKDGLKKLRLKDITKEDFSIPYFYGKYKWLLNIKEEADTCEPYIRKLPWNKTKLTELFSRLRQRDNLVLWGIGDNGEKFLEMTIGNGIFYKYIIDKDKDKQGKVIHGYKIKDENSFENGNLIVVLNPDHIIMIQYEMAVQKKKADILDVRAFLCFEIEYEEAFV